MVIEERIDRLETDMYTGNGKENPPVLTRLDRVENTAAGLNKLQWVIIVGIIAAIGDILSQHLKW
jgi:hypothetical protein